MNVTFAGLGAGQALSGVASRAPLARDPRWGMYVRRPQGIAAAWEAPVAKGGVNSASDDLDDRSRAGLAVGASAEPGIATGDDYVVIDVDPRNGGKKSLESLEPS